jgi:hypothetical protein
VTDAQTFVAWAQNNSSYEDDPFDTLYEYEDSRPLLRTIFYVSNRPTGEERRWDRERELVWRFPDGSHVIARFWEALQDDHADGVEPDASWFVAEPYEEVVTRYRVVV